MAASRTNRFRRLPQPRGARLPTDEIANARLSSRGKEAATAFVLAGGGNLGAIQAGMLRALAERKIRPDLVVGCSVGAINGAAFAIDPTLAGARLLEQRWRDVSGASVMPPGRLPGAVQLLRKGESIHPNTGLRALIEAFLGTRHKFEDLTTRFECVATDMATSAEHWFSRGQLIEPLLASAALPAVFPPVEVRGRRYLDGGVVNNVPVSRAIELGAERVFVLHVGSHGRPQTTIRRPVEAALIGYWIARNCRFTNDLADVPAGVQVIVLSPEHRPELRYDDFSETERLIAEGYGAASAVLNGDDYQTLMNPQPRWMRVLGVARPGVVIGDTTGLIAAPTEGEAAETDHDVIAAISEADPSSAESDDAAHDAAKPNAASPHGDEAAVEPTILDGLG